MEYDQLVQAVMGFNCIGNREERAEEAVKVSMSCLACQMSEEDAKEFVNYLPEPLTLDKLRQDRELAKQTNPEKDLQVVASRFHTDTQEAQQLVKAVLQTAKGSLRPQQLNAWKEKLPPEWASFLERA